MTDITESPCKTCLRKDEDKRACAKICTRLDAWRDEDPQWETFRIPTPEELGEAGGGHKKTDPTTCKHDGCDNPVKYRGFCLMHYDQWRHGMLPGYPPFKATKARTAPENTRKKTAAKKTTQQPESVRPKAETDPGAFQYNIDLTDYPDMERRIIETATKLLVSPQHVIISLIGEGLALRSQLTGALKQS